MLRNYDPLVREVSALNDLVSRLRDAASADTEEAAAIDRLAASVGRQEELTEQFKSNNALLQNSLAYFRLFTPSFRSGPEWPSCAGGRRARSGHAAADARHLAAAGGRSPIDWTSSPRNLFQLLTRPGPRAAGAWQLLRDLLPRTDRVLNALLEKPSKRSRKPSV